MTLIIDFEGQGQMINLFVPMSKSAAHDKSFRRYIFVPDASNDLFSDCFINGLDDEKIIINTNKL